MHNIHCDSNNVVGVVQISGEVSAVGSPYGWYSQNLQDYSTGFAAIFDVLISSNRSHHILTMLQDGHYIDEQTASRPTIITSCTLYIMYVVSKGLGGFPWRA